MNYVILFLLNRALEEKRARLGLVECVNHDLLQPYPVLHEKPGTPLFSLFLQDICMWFGWPHLFIVLSRIML